MSEKTLFISFILLILTFKSGNLQCFNAEEMTVSQLGLSESQIWNAKAQDLEQCAKLCVRRKPCQSITFDTQSGMCELNGGTRDDTPTRTGKTLLYSEFQWWSPSLDKNCHSRPCQDSEACIPGSLAGGSPDCSYSCMTVVRDVCPLPPWGVSNGRTVGSFNVYTCGKGTVGGGTAKCLPSKQWDKEINPTCTPILGHPCTDDSICSLINGYCSNEGQCECGPYKRYVETDNECVLDCGDPPAVANSNVSGNTTTQTYECNADYFPTAGSEATVTCTETGWEPAGRFACYTCGEPPVVAGATVLGDGEVRQYSCDELLYPLPVTGNGSITCDEATKSWKPGGFLCGGLRLVPGLYTEMMEYFPQFSGYLEMFADGNWRALTQEGWTWQATMVACRTLFGLG
ncbi:uncharacterized protein LOC123562528 [Mercenaria mercenaria]|uniref:uncharacterized protein LOC123562528 n=1 Tax=Mercenaria mercenaria TaxID=6596 RepID=UPI00234ED82F|nr:uncharacterized protein LOC123562528 [Mercenaria mercenaria]